MSEALSREECQSRSISWPFIHRRCRPSCQVVKSQNKVLSRITRRLRISPTNTHGPHKQKILSIGFVGFVSYVGQVTNLTSGIGTI